MGKDFTIYSTQPGYVVLERKRIALTDFKKNKDFKIRKYINVVDKKPHKLALEDIR